MFIQEIDHITSGVSNLTSVFDNSDNVKKLLEVILEPLQEIEKVLIDLSNQKDIDTVEGIWLDYIGEIVGEKRNGRNDEDYRKALLLRVIVNKADGTPDSVYKVVKTYTESDKVRIAEGIMSWGHIIYDGSVNSDSSLYHLIQEVKPVTTNMVIMEDIGGACFLPTWELTLQNLSEFQVFDGTVSSGLELVLSATETTTLFVNILGGIQTYDPDTPFERSVLEWEEPENFELYNGEPLELQVDINTVSDLVVAGVINSITGETLLPWEVTLE